MPSRLSSGDGMLSSVVAGRGGNLPQKQAALLVILPGVLGVSQ